MKINITAMQLKYKRILYSCLSIIVCLALFYAFYFTDKPDQKFGMGATFLLLRYFALWSGLILLSCRLISLIKRNDSIIYIAAGALNIILGVAAFALYISHNMIMQILHLFLMNLLLGVIIMSDCLFFKKIF